MDLCLPETTLDGPQEKQTEEVTQKNETKKIKVEKMDTGHKRDSTTMLDQNGHYPNWMHPRHCKRLKRKRLRKARKNVH